jgi:hypothetical protein
MKKIDKIIHLIRYLKEEGMSVSGTHPTNNAGASGLGFDPQKESPPVRKKYAYLGKGSRSRWMMRRNPPK